MKISGTSSLTADRDAVWRALTDPQVLVVSIPGCQRLESVGEDAYTMTVSAGVGSIKGTYDGRVSLHDQQEPNSFRMHAKGAGAPGTIGADVQVRLEPKNGGGTTLTYDADATVGGMIGGVGQRMLTGVSKRMAEEFFRNVDSALAGAAPAGLADNTGAAGPSGLASRGLPPDPATTAPALSAQPAGTASVGTVFTAPGATARSDGGPGFVVGVAVGAGAALVGAVVGAWIAGRRR